MSPRFDVAVDVGQSGLRGVLVEQGGDAFDFSESFGVARGFASTIELVAERLAANGVDSIATLSIGATGLWGDAARFDVAGVRDAIDVGTVIVADDCLTSFLGALGMGPGVVIAIGTGVVGAGGSGSGSIRRVGGWGLWTDDRGSGAWIGQQALHAAIDSTLPGATRGRAVAELCASVLGDLGSLPERLHTAASAPALLATLCGPLAGLAEAGDPDAVQIFSDAGESIGALVLAAADAAGLHSDVPVCLIGGVARAQPLLDRGVRRTIGDAITFRYAPARGDSLAGARALLDVAGRLEPSPMLAVHRRPAEA